MSRAAFALALVLAAALPSDGADPGAPARNWVLPLFTKDGYHSMTLRGSEVRPVGSDRIDIVDLNIAVFSGDAAARVRTILLSPAASYFANENRAIGPRSVRVIRQSAEITGEDWTYVQAGEKISMQRNVRVVLRATLPGLLK
jgi:hypothetical protein